MRKGHYARVVVDVGPAHLDRLFDYAVPEGDHVDVGTRVRVPFHGRTRTAWVAEVAEEPSVEPERVKPLDRVDGPIRWFDPIDLKVWRWVADRFAGTLSGAINHALPDRIVRVEREAASWGPPSRPDTGAIGASPASAPIRPRSRRNRDAESEEGEGQRVPPPCASTAWRVLDGSALLKAAWEPAGEAFHLRPPLHHDLGPLLVDLVARTTAGGRQALVLTPDPAPGPVDDIVAALGRNNVADLRHLPADADRYRGFLRLRRGDIDVAVGERGLALMPLAGLGLIVVVDEANPAYKERRNPRHHAREAALARGRIAGATVVLTSSLQSGAVYRSIAAGHITPVRADRASERANAPTVQLVDRTTLSPGDRRTRLAGPITDRVKQVVADGGTVIVLAAARGSGSSLACKTCRARHECRECGAGLSPVDNADQPLWRCAVCGWTTEPRACLDCGGTDTFPLRAGAKRLATELAKTHPDAEVAHMEGFDQPGPTSRPAIAVMTRGSVVHRPEWLGGSRADLLVVADPDVLLGRPEVDAAEDALRLWLDGAALADQLMIQTTNPTAPAIQALVRLDPDGFWPGEHDRRAPLGWPPAGTLIRFTSLPADAAEELRREVPGTLLGPDPDGVALLKTDDARGTISALGPLRRQWALDDRRIRVDVDPVVL